MVQISARTPPKPLRSSGSWNRPPLRQGDGTIPLPPRIWPAFCREKASCGSADTLRTGLGAFGRKLPGYTAPDAILTGLETRTSSPVRLPRGEDFQSVQLPGLYPCGEGAGYAGGIMSAAVDGLRVARAIVERYAPANE